MNGIDSASDGEDALRAGVTPASSDAYYKAKLRAGFIDLRNSYNEKIRPRTNTYPNRQLGGPPPVPRELGRVAERSNLPADMAPAGKSLVGRRELYRSNSSLELDRMDNGSEGRDTGALHREYGSASSLDVVSSNGDTFFAMLQDYRNENLDQRAPPPPQIQEVLRGKVDLPPKTPTSLSPNGKVPNGAVSGEDIPDGSHSPKMKTKSQKSKERKQRNKSVVGDSSSGGGIFKKLRGKPDSAESSNTKTSEGNAEVDPKVEERQKRKALVHYDCQSVGINLTDVIKRKNSLNRRRNTKTGASAASGAAGPRTENSHQAMAEDDNGDGKTNDLVLSCPYFRNEIGGEEERMISLNRMTAQKRVQNLLGNMPCGENSALMRRPACNGVAILDNSPSPTGIMPPALLAYKGLVIEHVDHGAFYYRHFFHNYEHQNFFGLDDNIGPVAVSVKREKLSDGDSVGVRPDPATGALYQYRIIVRTSELQTLRGVILEETIPCSSRLSSTRGLPPKDVLEFVVPELQISCLKAATPGNRTEEQLMMLDEQGLTQHYKIGIMYCRPGQATEEEMYNNEHAGSIFDQFLDCIGQRVRLKGFDKYRGGLDSKTDSTGTQSLFAAFHNYEVMFHVSTMLPFTPNNRQQLLRKRHIGNDIVTIVFQEPGALPFTPRSVRSHFQHVFIIVRAHHCDGDKIKYSMAVTRSKDVPPFGPPIADGSMFDPSPEFTEFLLTKAINAENAAHKSEKFTVMATRTRQEYIKDMATNFVTTSNLDSGSKLSKFSLGSGRKKEKPKTCQIPDIWARGCLVWGVEVEDFGSSLTCPCYLGIAADTFVIIEDDPHHVLFTMPCRSIIAWTAQADSVRLYYDHGECLALRVASGDQEEVQEIVDRLRVVSTGCETTEMTLRRNGLGQLGFHLHYDAIVADVEPHGFAWQAGLRQGSRLVEICKVATATLTHDQMIDLLRTSVTVKVIVVKPHEDGSPRRGCEDLGSSHSSLSSPHTPSSDRLLLEDESTTATLRNIAMATKHTNHPEPQAMPMTSSSHSHRNPAHYTDTHPDRRTDHTDRRNEHTDSQHDKQPSRDSTGSRSSGHGSMDGPNHQEGRSGWMDTTPGDRDGFASGDERISRHNYSDHSEDRRGDWNSRGSSYAPYGRDQTGYSPPSPHHHQVDGWFDHGATSDGELRTSSYQGNSAYLSRTANLPQTSKPPSAYTASAHGTAESQATLSYGGSDPSKWDTLPVGSAGDPSLRSSQHGRSHGQEGNSQRDDRDNWSRNPVNKSPSLRRPQLGTIGAQQRRSYLEASPSSSNQSSPKNQRRGQQGSSSESLANRLRPGVSTSTKITTSPGSSGGGSGGGVVGSGSKHPKSSTFQEELMRLIDPDVSLAELENSINKPSKLKLPARPPRLQRTLSDESLCSTQLNRNQQTYGQEVFSADVLFGANKLSSSRENLDRVHRGPGADLVDKGLERTQDSRNLAASSPLLPLPDAAMGLDWNNLLDAANKAFRDEDGRGPDKSRLLSLHLSKSADNPPNRHESADQIYQNIPARPPPLDRTHKYESLDKTTQNPTERLTYLREQRQLHGSHERLNYGQPDRVAQYDAANYGSQERLHYNLHERLGHVRDRPGHGSQERLHNNGSDYEYRKEYESQERLNDRYTERLKERRDHGSRERLNYAGHDGYDHHSGGPAPMAPPRHGSLDRSSRGSIHSDGAAGEPQAHGGSGPGSSAGSSPNQRWQELEAQLSRLEHQLGEERQQRLTLEARVQQLTLDNVRLQEESTTAAQQLRRFTEWFFNTIDRQ